MVYLLVAVLLIGLIAVADRAGFFSFLSVCINLVLLLFALHCYLTGWNIMALTACMIFLFTVLSLLIGQRRQPAFSVGNCCYAAFYCSHGGYLLVGARGDARRCNIRCWSMPSYRMTLALCFSVRQWLADWAP